MSCANSSASARQKCKKTTCLLAGNCGCNPQSSFFAGPRTLLQDLTCGSNCDAPITVEAWSGGAPGAPGATGTTVGLELCDKLVFWSGSLDISVTEGSAVVNIESGITGVGGSNVGGGAEVFKQSTGTTLEFRTLIGGTGIGVVQNTNDITINMLLATDTVPVEYTYNLGSSPYNNVTNWPISKIGNVIYLHILQDTQTDMTGYQSITLGSSIPSGFRPSVDIILPVKIWNSLNVNATTATIQVTSTGIITIYNTGTFGVAPNLGGFASTYVSWIV